MLYFFSLFRTRETSVKYYICTCWCVFDVMIRNNWQISPSPTLYGNSYFVIGLSAENMIVLDVLK